VESTEFALDIEGVKSSPRINRKREIASDESSVAHAAARVKRPRLSTQSHASSAANMSKEAPIDAKKSIFAGLPGGESYSDIQVSQTACAHGRQKSETTSTAICCRRAQCG